MALHFLGLANGLRRARDKDLNEAKIHMLVKTGAIPGSEDEEQSEDDSKYHCWTLEGARAYANSKAGRCIVIIDRYVVDATPYLGEHVRQYLFFFMIAMY